MTKDVDRKRLSFEKGYTYLNRNMVMEKHPDYIYQSLLNDFKAEAIDQYPDMWATYSALSKYLDVPQEQLLISRGVEGAFKIVFETLTNFGDRVGILTPTCAMYHVYAEVYGTEVVKIKGSAPDYKITIDQIKKVAPSIKVLFLDNPKSHLPSHFTDEELYIIIKHCEDHGVIVFLDEVYTGWENNSYSSNLHKHDNLIISSSFSKVGFPSMKAGWLIANEELKRKIESPRSSYELNYFACKTMEHVIDNASYITDLKERILGVKNIWYNKLFENESFKTYNSKSYVLRLYSEDERLIRKIYDDLYAKKIVVNLIDEVNLTFSVTSSEQVEKDFFDVVFS